MSVSQPTWPPFVIRRCWNRSTCTANCSEANMLYRICHNYIGYTCIGHDYIGHNYIGHEYIGHDYIGHNYMGARDICACHQASTPSPSLPLRQRTTALLRTPHTQGLPRRAGWSTTACPRTPSPYGPRQSPCMPRTSQGCRACHRSRWIGRCSRSGSIAPCHSTSTDPAWRRTWKPRFISAPTYDWKWQHPCFTPHFFTASA